jgi:protein O-GlcNAc transferase
MRLVKARLALVHAPSDAPAWCTAGMELHRQGFPEVALAAFERVVELAPLTVDAWMAVATLRAELGRPVSALDACNEALRLDPEEPLILQNAAILMQRIGDRSGALLLLNIALQRDPSSYSLRQIIASVLISLQRSDEAAVLLTSGLQERPDDVDCLYALADVELARSRFQEASDLFDRLLFLRPLHTGGRIGQAVAAAVLGREEKAQELLDAAFRDDPRGCANWPPFFAADQIYGRALLDVQRFRVAIESAALYRCDWSRRELFVQWLAEKCASGVACGMSDPDTPFVALGLELLPSQHCHLAKQVALRLQRESGSVPVRRVNRGARVRLRVAYLAGDLRQHPVGRLFSPIFSLHDRQRFEVFVYHTGPFEDCAPRHRAEQGSDVFRDVSCLSVAALAQLIAADGVDILVDLSGYTLYGRTAALSLRPAPVQVSYMGFLGTLGADYVDYAFADRYSLLPEVRTHWTESIVYLPATFFLTDDSLQLPISLSGTDGRKTYGLPENGCVLACLNYPWKIEPSTFAVWMRVLEAVPGSVLWLFDGGGAQVRAVLSSAAQAHGIAPERLVFAPRVPYEDYLRRYQYVDLVLNTGVYAGNTTTMEALAMGVPVLSLAGKNFPSRAAAGMLVAHGIPECVSDSLEDYEREAIRLASSPERLALLRKKTRACRSTSRLFRTNQRVRELERAYETMWARHSAGLPPADFDVPPLDT